ncbi:MAG: cysteine desulfurase [Cellulomonadaceae bacterium]|jgi:cysteine desulfurase|nr:cysteine desulfurase [Cellulomonadaceae bacterium]
MTVAYLDHASTTPMTQAALDAYADEALKPGNPSSLHTSGRAARRVVEESRETIASVLGARPSEVVFTSGGTEADNLAIKGIFWGRRAQDARRTRVLVSAIEHHAVLDPAFWLAEHAGAEIVLLPVDGDGFIDLDAVRDELEAGLLDDGGQATALVSVMWANNEVGTIQPIHEVVRLAHRYGVPVHTDAVQAVGQIPVDFAACGADAMTVTAHKCGGPIGVGALIATRDLAIQAVQHGGGQERGVRSGTLDAPGIRSFAVAVADAVGALDDRAAHLAALRDNLVARVRAAIPDAVLRGPDPAGLLRLPANAHFTFPGCEGDSLLYLLDSHGVEASTGSACQAGVPRPSHVLLAMGVDESDARGALRFSLGPATSQSDIDALIDVLPAVVDRAQLAGQASGLTAKKRKA